MNAKQKKAAIIDMILKEKIPFSPQEALLKSKIPILPRTMRRIIKSFEEKNFLETKRVPFEEGRGIRKLVIGVDYEALRQKRAELERDQKKKREKISL